MGGSDVVGMVMVAQDCKPQHRPAEEDANLAVDTRGVPTSVSESGKSSCKRAVRLPVKPSVPLNPADWLASARAEAIVLAGIGLAHFTPSGEVRYLDEQAWRLLELETHYPVLQSVCGHFLPELFFFHEPEDMLRRRLREEGQIAGLKYPLRTLRGTEKWLLIDAQILKEPITENEVIQVFLREVTDDQRAVALLELQRDLAVDLASVADLDRALAMLIETMGKIVDFDSHLVYLPDTASGGFFLATSRNISDVFQQNNRLWLPESPEAAIAQAGESCYMDTRVLSSRLSPAYRKEGFRAMAILPVLQENHPVAVLLLGSRRRAMVSAAARAAIEAILAQLGGVIERTRVQAEVQERERRYRRITEAVTDYVFSVWVENQIAVNTIHSPACEAVTGYSAEEFRHDPWLWIRMVHDDDRELVSNQAVRILREYDASPIEHRIIRKDGQERWVSNTPVLHFDAEHRLISYDGLIRDISSRKRAEHALRESEQRFRMLVENAADAFFLTDSEGNIVDVNQQACTSLGYAREELLTCNVTDLDTTFSTEKYKQFWNSLKRGEVITEVGTQHQKNGHEIPVEVRMGMFRSGNSEYMLALARDISDRLRADTERRALEEQFQQAQKMESLGILAGGIAHDFNNLLMIILGNVDLMLAEEKPTTAHYPRLKEIEEGARTAAELCGQLLAYAGRSPVAMQAACLNNIILDMTHLLDTTLSRRAQLILELDGSLPLIEADPVRIQQILMNLLTNAAEAISHRDGKIRLHTRRQHFDGEFPENCVFQEAPQPGDYVVLDLQDNGSGMDGATLQRIFDPFFTTKFAGRGLGLGAVLGIMRAHHGFVAVSSTPGIGTTFHLGFPISHTTAPAKETPGENVITWRGSGTILAVDDEEGPRLVCKRMLERTGFDVVTAVDGVEALKWFMEDPNRPCLVVLDLTMPKMSGEEVLAELRRIRPTLPVILSSGFTERALTSIRDYDPPVLFIQKPYRVAQLVEKIRYVLGQ